MKMQHVSIFVSDMDASIAFYENVVGHKVIKDFRAANPDHQVIFLAEEAGDTKVELIKDVSTVYSGGGISMGFNVPDLEAERARLEKLGVNPGPMISPMPGVKFFFVTDPNGVTVQIAQG